VQESSNILLLNLNHIGDVLFTTPAIRALRNMYPKAKMTCVVTDTVADVLRGNPNIDRLVLRSNRKLVSNAVMGLKLRKEKFATSICFTFSSSKLALIGFTAGARRRIGFSYRSIRPLLTDEVFDDNSKHRVETYMDLVRVLGPVDTEYPMEMFVSEADARFADELLSDSCYNDEGPLVALNPGGSKAHNQWFPERYAAVGDKLQAAGARVVVLGGPGESGLGQEIAGAMKAAPIVAAGRTSVGQTAGIISRSRLMISGDTGPLHMAVSLRVPSIAIFGPTDPARTGIYKGKGEVLWGRPSCAPCARTPDCGFKACMDAVTADMVFAEAENLLR
jgi:heptosyltransferase II